MALPSSGQISFGDINVELGLSATAQISMNDTAVRTLFGIGAGAINMSNGHGKSNAFAFTISSNQTNANLATLGTAAGWDGTTKLVATVASGVYISSNSTGTPALTVSGSFPGGVELINNGTIVGRGGDGGRGATWSYTIGSAGTAAGGALSVSSAITITNNGTIAGGGGGGGGGAGGDWYVSSTDQYGGVFAGGGGGGRSSLTNSSGGPPGHSLAGAGAAGTISAAGGGGGGGNDGGRIGGAGGAGGGWGSSGSTGGYASGSNIRIIRGPFAGGSGGYAVSGNSNVTWATTGTRLGAIS